MQFGAAHSHRPKQGRGGPSTDRAGRGVPTGRGARAAGRHVRTCVGCGGAVCRDRARAELVRLVFVPSAEETTVVVDLAGSAKGRGAWVHPTRRCLEQACRKGLSRAASAPVFADRSTLVQEITVAAVRRVDGLLASARRAGSLAVGATAVGQSWQRGSAKLVIVAADAAAGSRLTAVRQAAAEGMAVAWGTKSHWGRTLSTESDELGVLAIESESIATEVMQVVALAESAAADENVERGHSSSPGGGGEGVPLERTSSNRGSSSTGNDGPRRCGGEVRFRAE